jgi:molecular chaperone GrpE (heat shock protein)
MTLTIKINFGEGNGVEMETNLNKAIEELSSSLKKKGLIEMELEGQDFDNNFKQMYLITIEP